MKYSAFISLIKNSFDLTIKSLPHLYELRNRSGRHGSGDNPSTDKRAHHNALERKRRDHIKDSFSSLRDAIPTMQV